MARQVTAQGEAKAGPKQSKGLIAAAVLPPAMVLPAKLRLRPPRKPRPPKDVSGIARGSGAVCLIRTAN